VQSLKPTLYEKIMAYWSLALLGVVFIALVRGLRQWVYVQAVVWWHLAFIICALSLTPLLLLRRRGDRLHRILGWIWVLLLGSAAFESFAVQTINPGHFSFIHPLSLLALVSCAVIVLRAKRHDVAGHRRLVRFLISGALLLNGFYTFVPGRMLAHWLYG
jgi:uncharacterized membrane protein